MNTIFKKLVLALFGVFFAANAYALNVDQNRIVPARDSIDQKLMYCRVTINWNDPRISTGQKFCSLPNNAYVLAVDAQVVTAFNAGSTNVVTLGVTAASANEFVAGSGSNASITPGSTGMYHLTAAAGLGLQITGNTSYQTNNGVTLYAKFAQTGTAASAGSVTFVIAYAVNNDQ